MNKCVILFAHLILLMFFFLMQLSALYSNRYGQMTWCYVVSADKVSELFIEVLPTY